MNLVNIFCKKYEYKVLKLLYVVFFYLHGRKYGIRKLVGVLKRYLQNSRDGTEILKISNEWDGKWSFEP